MLLVNLLILFFILLISYQIFLAIFFSYKEGLQNSNSTSSTGSASGSTSYKPYTTSDMSNALILAQQNANNISYLNNLVQDLSGNVTSLQTQLTGVIAAQQQYTSSLSAAGPPNVTGT